MLEVDVGTWRSRSSHARALLYGHKNALFQSALCRNKEPPPLLVPFIVIHPLPFASLGKWERVDHLLPVVSLWAS